MIGALIFVRNWNHRRTPEYAVEQIRAIGSEADIKDHEDYLTERGRKIFAIALSAEKDVATHLSIGEPTADGDAVAAPFKHPKAEGRLEFKKDGVWQLDNIIITKLNGGTFYADLASVGEPLQALVKAIEDKSPGQVMADNRYLTDKGKRVRLRMLKQHNGHSGGDNDPVVDEPVINGNTAYFSMHGSTPNGETEICFQVVNTYDGWKFDDFIVVKANGKTINQSLAEQIDNPLWVWFKSALW